MVRMWLNTYFLLCVFFKCILGQEWISYLENICMVGTNACDSADLDTLRAVLYVQGDTYSYTLDEVGASETMANPHFDLADETVFFVYGYTATNNSESAITIRDAYAQYGGKKNFFMIYTDVVYGGVFIEPANYVRASQETVCVGELMGKFLVALYKRNLSASNIHLIGHSLGAQTIHAAAQHFISRVGVKMRRLTGLDPAGPCFDPNPYIQLNSKDADLVDIIHTNAPPMGLGTATKLGLADFMPDGGAIQPGCVADLGCSHGRGIHQYASSMKTTLCIASPSESFTDFQVSYKRLLNSDSVPMGYNWNGEAGIFFMHTDGDAPFCKGYAGINDDELFNNTDTPTKGVGVTCLK